MDRNFGGGFGPRGNPPVQVGEELEVKIEAVGAKGDGIAKKDGFVLFIPNTNEGDTVRVKVTKVLNKVGFADVVGQGSGSSEAAPATAEPEEETFDTSKDSEDFGEEETEAAPAEEAPVAEKPAVEEETEDEIVEEVEEKLDEEVPEEEPAAEEPVDEPEEKVVKKKK
jgi:predicted RNA-binding protein with TRAM domain